MKKVNKLETIQYPEFDDMGTALTPDFVASECGEIKVRAWYIKDDPHKGDEGIYVYYSPDKYENLRRGFTLNPQQAIDLIDDLEKALDRYFGHTEDTDAQEVVA